MGFPQNKKQQPEQSEALKRFIARQDALAEIDITRTLERLGADSNQDGDRSKWKIPGVGNIIIKGQSWKNVNTNVHKGFGSVSLVRHAKEFKSNKEAMLWLEEGFGKADALPQEFRAQASAPRERPQFFDPPPTMEAMWNDVRAYLTGSAKGERGLPPSLVDDMHGRGTLYASKAFDNIRKR